MDKQFVFMSAVTAVAVVGGIGFGPYIAILVYYLNTVLRPQNMWDFVPAVKTTSWSLFAALAAIGTAVLYRIGLVGYPSCGPTRGARVPVWGPIHWCFAAFAGWICLRHAITLNQWVPEDVKRSDEIFNEYYKLFVMFAVSALVIQRLSQLWTLMVVVTVADVYVAYEMNAYYFKFRFNKIYTQGFGGLDNNGAALMLAMAIPLCYFLWEGTRSHLRWLYLAAIPVLIHAIMLTFSRGSMVAVMAVSPMVFMFSRHKRMLALIGVLGAAFVVATAGKELQDRFLSINQHEVDASANSRKTAWRVATLLATEHPFFGLGLRCSQRHMDKYGANTNQAIHSQYLQLAVDTGWTGMALFLVLVAVVLWTSTRFWWKSRKWPPYPEVIQFRAMAGGLTTAVITYCVGAAFLSLDNFELPYILFLIVAQLDVVYRGGGIEASVMANGSALPVKQKQLLQVPRYVRGAPTPAAPSSPALPPTPAD
jgi:probable O-glycosylation ligase (exosortase A-associated)